MPAPNLTRLVTLHRRLEFSFVVLSILAGHLKRQRQELEKLMTEAGLPTTSTTAKYDHHRSKQTET